MNVVPGFSDILHVFHKSFPSIPLDIYFLAFKTVQVSTQLMTWSTNHSTSVAVKFFLVDV